MSSARKLPAKYENPIDNFLVSIAEKLNPIFYNLGFNPNGITTLSLIFGILFNYYYFNKKYEMAATMMMISYFFDCMDGNFARTYNMQTKFGDYYDHIKDVLVMLVFAGILFLYNDDASLKFKIFGLRSNSHNFWCYDARRMYRKICFCQKLKNINKSGFLDNLKYV